MKEGRGADEKELRFVSGAIKTPPFSSEARVEAGELLRALQQGEALSLPHSRPMPSIGAGVHELRIRDSQNNFRILYYLDTDTILILEVFAKKTEKTPLSVIENVKARLTAYQATKAKSRTAKEK